MAIQEIYSAKTNLKGSITKYSFANNRVNSTAFFDKVQKFNHQDFVLSIRSSIKNKTSRNAQAQAKALEAFDRLEKHLVYNHIWMSGFTESPDLDTVLLSAVQNCNTKALHIAFDIVHNNTSRSDFEKGTAAVLVNPIYGIFPFDTGLGLAKMANAIADNSSGSSQYRVIQALNFRNHGSEYFSIIKNILENTKGEAMWYGVYLADKNLASHIFNGNKDTINSLSRKMSIIAETVDLIDLKNSQTRQEILLNSLSDPYRKYADDLLSFLVKQGLK